MRSSGLVISQVPGFHITIKSKDAISVLRLEIGQKIVKK